MCICRNQYRFSPANVKSRFSTNLQVIITSPLLRSMLYRCNGSTKSSNVCRKKKLPNGRLIYSPNPKNKPSNCKKSLGFLFYLCVTPLHFSFLISSPLPQILLIDVGLCVRVMLDGFIYKQIFIYCD